MSLYLILHRVRGEPALDVAERCEDMGTEDDPGPWWIIPTSGHRAFPYNANSLEATLKHGCVGMLDDRIPDDWPDHYQVSVAPRKAKPTDAEEWKMLEELGFTRKGATITRRFG